MYKNASNNAQRQARQLWLRDLMKDGVVALTPEQERENLVAHLKAVEKSLLETPKGRRRDELGKKKYELQQAISSIRPKMKGPKGVEKHFIEVCREELPEAQFKRFMHDASNRAKSDSYNDIDQRHGD